MYWTVLSVMAFLATGAASAPEKPQPPAISVVIDDIGTLRITQAAPGLINLCQVDAMMNVTVEGPKVTLWGGHPCGLDEKPTLVLDTARCNVLASSGYVNLHCIMPNR